MPNSGYATVLFCFSSYEKIQIDLILVIVRQRSEFPSPSWFECGISLSLCSRDLNVRQLFLVMSSTRHRNRSFAKTIRSKTNSLRVVFYYRLSNYFGWKRRMIFAKNAWNFVILLRSILYYYSFCLFFFVDTTLHLLSSISIFALYMLRWILL